MIARRVLNSHTRLTNHVYVVAKKLLTKVEVVIHEGRQVLGKGGLIPEHIWYQDLLLTNDQNDVELKHALL